MTLVYRAMWQDDRPNLGDAVHQHFRDWVLDRSHRQIDCGEVGHYEASVMVGDGEARRKGEPVNKIPATITVETDLLTASSTGIEAVRHDYTIDTGKSRWRTKVRSWTDEANSGWCWVDNEVTGDDLSHPRMPAVVSPIVVRTMIETAVNPRVGVVDIATKPRRFTGEQADEELAGLVTHFQRSIPLVVFARSRARQAELIKDASYSSIVAETAKNLAGIAIVVDADEEVANGLTDIVGRDYGVFNGAVRVYASRVDPADVTDAYRHRYITADRYMGGKQAAAYLTGRLAGPESTLRRPPTSYYVADEKIDRAKFGAENFKERYLALSRDYSRARDEIVELRKEAVSAREWYEDNERLERLVVHAKKQLITSGVSDDFDLEREGAPYATPPKTSGDVVRLAQKYLSDRLDIHKTALRNAGDMDRSNSGVRWAEESWKGFKALYAYAEWRAADEANVDDFIDWCGSKANRFYWPSTKVASSESGETKRKAKSRKQLDATRARRFDVSPDLSTNKVQMLAHLKVQVAGNGNIPRIYYIYSSVTKKVHVGFYGPHSLVPNTKS